MGLFHAGVTWRAFACLVSLTAAIAVETERSLRIGSSRFVPDLVVRCVRTHRILLVIEVWHTHTVNAKKKAAFQAAGFPWIEVRSWHVISRIRRQPLPVLDWAGPGLPQPPEQHSLFAPTDDDQRLRATPSVDAQKTNWQSWRQCSSNAGQSTEAAKFSSNMRNFLY